MFYALTVNSVLFVMLGAGWAIACEETEEGDKQTGHVSMILSSASVSQGPFEIRCNVTLINGTGDALIVRSPVVPTTVFDAMELVITDLNGIIQRQEDLNHKSPISIFGAEEEVTLPRGATSRVMSFPIVDSKSLPKKIKVRLVGTLPGSGYTRICSSETVEVTVKK